MKISHSVLIILIICIIVSCNSNKYIKEVPFKFTYDKKEIEKQLSINQKKALPFKYEEELTDDQIYIKEKYSIILSINPKELKNYAFYAGIDEKLNPKNGIKDSIDMATFAQVLYNKAFKKAIPNTPLEIFKSPKIEKFTGREFLNEGDIIFLRYSKDIAVGGIAIYLRNGKILYSTKEAGLNIFNFNDDYFQIRYFASGRVLKEEKIKDDESIKQ